MKVDNENKSNNMENTKKRNPKVNNLLWRRVNIKMFLVNLRQDFKIVKPLLLE